MLNINLQNQKTCYYLNYMNNYIQLTCHYHHHYHHHHHKNMMIIKCHSLMMMLHLFFSISLSYATQLQKFRDKTVLTQHNHTPFTFVFKMTAMIFAVHHNGIYALRKGQQLKFYCSLRAKRGLAFIAACLITDSIAGSGNGGGSCIGDGFD
jgi:hypothetical protein